MNEERSDRAGDWRRRTPRARQQRSKAWIVLPISVVVLGVAFLVYDFFIRNRNPCDAIFSQTELRLNTNLNVIGAKGGAIIGREKIQELTSQAQVVALNLKTCCIMSQTGLLDGNTFLQCKGSADHYESGLSSITQALETQSRGEPGAPEDVARIEALLEESGQSADALQKIVNKAPLQTSASPGGDRVNLIGTENGGEIAAATHPELINANNGKEERSDLLGVNILPEVVFSFAQKRPATFDTFCLLIPEAHNWNPADFELLAGDESATGTFRSIGTFRTANTKLFDTPCQEFKFPVVTARYLKVRLLSSYDTTRGWVRIYEFQLWGKLS